ncbi:aminopeptidase N [Nocardioides cavernae]|uniref:Aminopeptidase N n=1 Tax=Nocardioides cavernae TaxID=1921566 RepID=A0ABR8NBT3_9ACTN|nr:aminopeptidase N [Nocardioides cavernae]MBD3925057.1 aminopeptidase N [Nocardioides cavernae]MBM7514569.1 aminopeptidase N [Nocardioides cavernae]
MSEARSLTQDEARERAALLEVDRYDLELDLTGLAEGDTLRVTTTIAFSAATAGGTTFVDCLSDVEEATLNGRALATGTPPLGRLELPDLGPDNVLVVRSVQRRTDAGQGIHRSVDPSDGAVYVWTSFEPDDARVVFPCFDQPDLKAVFGISVHAPVDWLVTSNMGSAAVTTADGTRRWTFTDTPRLSTYVPVVNAGPFVELRSTRDGYDLGLYARRSLAPMLDRDAEELFDLTSKGLAFYGEQFAMAFPEPRYDQVFVPEFGGAMENYGCVTWSDVFIFRDPPSYADREERALVLLHEMAHMWFGDMVTMRWWDDLWLNESFAEWACAWSAVRCTEFTDMWAQMLATEKQDAYAADAAPTTHPIRQELVDVATAAASFDAITYPKGAAVLKQLVAFVGEDSFLEGLRSYFATYAWGNTTLDDLIAEIESASGRDLSDWVVSWLETSGADRLTLERQDGGRVLVATAPGGRAPLPHRLQIGSYAASSEGLTLLETLSVEVAGERTQVDGGADGDLLLVNDDDLTFATVRPDPVSLEILLTRGGELPTAVGRTLALTTAWSLLYDGELGAEQLVDCGVGVLSRETADSVIEPLLGRLVDAADHWAPTAARDHLQSRVSDLCISLADAPGRRLAALRGLAQSATTPTQLEFLAAHATEPDLRWRRLIRLGELDQLVESDVESLLAEDPDPDAWVNALRARTARPSAEAKETAWQAVMIDRKVPQDVLFLVGRSFWRPGQDDLVTAYAERFLQALPELGNAGMLWALCMSRGFYPAVGGEDDFRDRLGTAAGQDGVSPVVRHNVRELNDRRRRRESARRAG